LNVSIGAQYLSPFQLEILVINKILYIDNVCYTLSSVIYGDESHFITRFIFDGRAYQGDGMKTLYEDTEDYGKFLSKK
jgi:hypothetical protein